MKAVYFTKKCQDVDFAGQHFFNEENPKCHRLTHFHFPRLCQRRQGRFIYNQVWTQDFQLSTTLLTSQTHTYSVAEATTNMFGLQRPQIRLEDSQERLQHAGEEVMKGGRNLWQGFSSWAMQDNILEVAVGLMFVVLPSPSSLDPET